MNATETNNGANKMNTNAIDITNMNDEELDALLNVETYTATFEIPGPNGSVYTSGDYDSSSELLLACCKAERYGYRVVECSDSELVSL